MTIRTALPESAKYLASAIRALSPAAALALTLATIFSAVGVADAATTAFVLGRSNHESSKASLSNSHGIPLALAAPKNKAPLSVNRQALVKKLNAQFVGGLSVAAAKATGGDGFVPPNANIQISDDVFTPVASTGKLPPGVYYVTATAMLDLTVGDTGGFCVIERKNNPGFLAEGGADGESFVQALETAAIRLTAKTTLLEACISSGTHLGSEAIDAGITAIRIESSHGKPPIKTGPVD